MPRSKVHALARRLLIGIAAFLPLILQPIASGARPVDADIPGTHRLAKALTLEQIQQSILANGYHWIARRTPLTDLSPEEKQSLLGYRPSPDVGKRPRHRLTDPEVAARLRAAGLPLPRTEDLPQAWDWRDHEGVTPIKDQGNCGSCWAFCSVAAIEGCARINDRVIYDLSEQQMLSCNDDGYGCGGGEMASCYEIFRDYGAIAEEEMPYQASDFVRCRQELAEPLARISGWLDLVNEVPTIKAALYNYGPVPCAMVVREDFMSYSGDCYDSGPGGDLNHCVLIVGWDDDTCGGIWICKNSWNTDWGEDGFFRIRWGAADIGSHAAALLYIPRAAFNFAHVPLVTTTWQGNPFEIETEITPRLAPVDSASVRLTYRVDGGEFTFVPMGPADRENWWRGEIPAQDLPSTVEYYIQATDQEGHSGTIPADAPEICYSFDVALVFDPFESSDSTGTYPGWIVGEPDDDATTGVWERVDPVGTGAQPEEDHTPTGTACWVTGQHVTGQDTGANDVDGGKTTLVSPVYELFGAGTARVKYWRWYSNDQGAAPGEDVWVVQARNDDGPWNDIERTRRSSNAWLLVERDLIDLLGPDLRKVVFRFVAADTGRGSAVEAAVDDFTLLADPDPILLGWDRTAGLAMSQPLPHPVRESALFRVEVDRATEARMRVFDVAGRLVAIPMDELLEKGRHAIVWNSRDRWGARLPSGVYYCILDLGGRRSKNSIVIVR